MIEIPEALRTVCEKQGLSLPEELTEEQTLQALPYLVEAVKRSCDIQDELQAAVMEEIRRAIG